MTLFLLQISFGWQNTIKVIAVLQKCRYLYLLTENKMMDKIAIFCSASENIEPVFLKST